jgi:hypothetical protein
MKIPKIISIIINLKYVWTLDENLLKEMSLFISWVLICLTASLVARTIIQPCVKPEM